MADSTATVAFCKVPNFTCEGYKESCEGRCAASKVRPEAVAVSGAGLTSNGSIEGAVNERAAHAINTLAGFILSSTVGSIRFS